MVRSGTIRNRLLGAAMLSFVFLSAAPRAHAVSKEMVELQTQVQQLLDQMQRLQSTMDSRFGVMQHLAEQTADAANQVTSTVNAMQKKLEAQNEAANGKVDVVSGQVQSLNDSVDELKARIAKLDKSVQDMQAQLQTIQAQAAQAPQAAMQPGGMTPAPSLAPGQNGAQPPAMPPTSPAASPAPPLQETLQAGIRDFSAGRSQVATGEFQDVIHYYPLDDMAGTARFYLGELAYQQQDYTNAITNYNAVLEGFSGNAKAASAQLHKGYALLATNKKDAAIHELRALIQRHPQTPEARAARSKLNELGVRIVPTATAAH